jgi:hypothetical protein
MPANVRDRLRAAVPLIGLALGVLTFYWIEAWRRRTPWVFPDELEWTQLSRSVAASGHAARRGEPIFFKSLYVFVIAPFWWIHSTSAAYAAIKYVNVVVMCLAAVPTYLTARMLVARRVAGAVAVLAIAIPAMSYTTSIVPEPLAYPWFVLTAWLSVRALAAPTRWSVALAVAAAAIGPLVRKEFVVLPVALLLAAAALWVLRDPGWRRALLAAGVVIACAAVFNWVVVTRVQTWHVGQYLNSHTIREGALAAGALTIGLGFLPVIGGLASLWLPERRGEPSYRAFAAYLAAVTLAMWVYVAGKATYLAHVYTPLIEERNLFYLSPLLLVGTALVLGARRIEWAAVALATAVVIAITWSGLFEVGAPYFEAPGLAVVTLVNRDFYWDINAFHYVALGATAASLALIALRRFPVVPALAALLACAWLLTGQIYATNSNTNLADKLAKVIPPPRSWVDGETHGRAVTFLGQLLTDDNQLWLTEFWNRSLHHVSSLDGSAPGPGPTTAPGLAKTDGTLAGWTGDGYVLAGPGVVLQAPVVKRRDGLTLYRIAGTWRLLNEEQDVFTDGWMPGRSAFTYFGRRPGVLDVHLSRTGYRGDAPPGRATIRVGTVKLDQNGVPTIDRVLALRRAVIRNGSELVRSIPVSSSPVTVAVEITPTFTVPGDSRQLGAQVAFHYRPQR